MPEVSDTERQRKHEEEGSTAVFLLQMKAKISEKGGLFYKKKAWFVKKRIKFGGADYGKWGRRKGGREEFRQVVYMKSVEA